MEVKFCSALARTVFKISPSSVQRMGMWPQTAKIFHFGERFAPLPGSATTGVERHAKISESSEIGCKVCVQHFEHLEYECTCNGIETLWTQDSSEKNTSDFQFCAEVSHEFRQW